MKSERFKLWTLLAAILSLPYGCATGDSPKEPVDRNRHPEETDTRETVKDFSGESDQEKEISEALKNEAEAAPTEPAKVNKQPAERTPPPSNLTSTRIYYVKAETTKVLKEPVAGAATLASLEKGERIIVVSIRGVWAELSSGGYIKTADITVSAVGGTRRKTDWQKKLENTP